MECNSVFPPWNINFLINEVVDACLSYISTWEVLCLLDGVYRASRRLKEPFFSVIESAVMFFYIWGSKCCRRCDDLLLIDFSFLFFFFSLFSLINARLFSFCLLFQFQSFFFFDSLIKVLFFFISVLQFQYGVI